MSFSEQETKFNINMIFRAKFEKKSFLTPPTCQKGQQRVIQEQSSLRDLLFFHQIMAACKNSANPNGPVTRSRIKPSFFICYTLERLWPLPQPKRLRCDIVHGHLESLVPPLRATCFWLLVPIISLLRIRCTCALILIRAYWQCPSGTVSIMPL